MNLEVNVTKKSYGIVLCRRNEISNKLEMLLVRKRFTYSFSDFVLGRYNRKSNSIRESLFKLFSTMTPTEYQLVQTLDFDKMWRYLWLGDVKPSYAYKKKIFDVTLSINGGSLLNHMLAISTPN